MKRLYLQKALFTTCRAFDINVNRLTDALFDCR
jgi:hypothetical protein